MTETKKRIVYSMRMSPEIKEMLELAARRERRTVASLLDKIIVDYLKKEGYLALPDYKRDRRRSNRKRTNLPAISIQKTEETEESFPCLIIDLSPEGVLLSFPKGSGFKVNSIGDLPRFKISFPIPDVKETVFLDCAMRHIRDTGNEIHVGCSFEPGNFQKQEILQKYIK
jgi:predicted DNA-binding protein